MSLLTTYLAAKAKSIRNEQHWQNEVQLEIRPKQIKLKAGEQLNAINAQLKADPELKKAYDSIKLTMPQD
jgi:hypothetical protein